MHSITGKGYLFQETSFTMKNQVIVSIPNNENIVLELDDSPSPQTVRNFLKHLPFSVKAHMWGEEIYTDESPISIGEENAKSTVSLNDVAYWPQGKAICLFYGQTPIGKSGEITPYSPVNVIGKILNPDKKILSKISMV
jgi:uncharacterized protein